MIHGQFLTYPFKVDGAAIDGDTVLIMFRGAIGGGACQKATAAAAATLRESTP